MANEPQKSGQSSEPAGRAVASRDGHTHPIQRLHDEMDRMVDRFFGSDGRRSLLDWDWTPFRETRTRAPLMRMPQIDIHENGKAYTIEAELAGMAEEDVDLELKEDVLTLRGEKKAEAKEEKENYHLTERSYGSFERSFVLPEGVDRENIAATFRNGVLCVTLPKTAKAQAETKKIKIGR